MARELRWFGWLGAREPTREWPRWPRADYAETAVPDAAPFAFQGEKPNFIGLTTPTCPPWFRRNRELGALKGLPMLGYFVVSAVLSAVVVLIGLRMFVRACVTITRHDSKNAANIITAMGKSFPLSGIWSRRR